MPGHLMTVALMGLALFQGAEPAADAPVTKEAAPAESSALPAMDLPAKTVQGDPSPPQSVAPSQTTAETAADAAPKAETKTDATADGKKSDSTPAAKPVMEELIRPTEKKDQSGKKAAAFWFITTGK